MNRLFTDPTPQEIRYLTPFEVGEDKILLYGFPPIMALHSELIKSMLDKLDTKEPNVLAPKIKIDKDDLMNMWAKLNGVSLAWDDRLCINLWPWLNYFDIDIEGALMKFYLNYLITNFPADLLKPENNHLLDDMLGKISVIASEKYNQLLKAIAEAGEKL